MTTLKRILELCLLSKTRSATGVNREGAEVSIIWPSHELTKREPIVIFSGGCQRWWSDLSSNDVERLLNMEWESSNTLSPLEILARAASKDHDELELWSSGII